MTTWNLHAPPTSGAHPCHGRDRSAHTQTNKRKVLERGFDSRHVHKGQPMPTKLNDVDEALQHLSLVPDDERGPAWYAYMDTLLNQKNKENK